MGTQKMKNKKDFLKKIQFNIDNYGYHMYLVKGSSSPTIAYTIGLKEKLDFELIIAGASYYSNDEVVEIINLISKMCSHLKYKIKSKVYVNGFGEFVLKEINKSWCDLLMLGAVDYYGNNEFTSYQIIPSKEFVTIDVPDMSTPFDSSLEPIWSYEKENWNYSISPNSFAVTNLNALRGKDITEVVRWEDEQWEMFSGAGPAVTETDIRLVPLSTLLKFDSSLEIVTELEIGTGLWRESLKDKWHKW